MKIIYFFPVLTCALFLFLLSPSLLAEKLHPPWKKPSKGGVNFTVEGIDNVPDLHGEIANPDLVIFFGGNQFMVLPEIMEAFKKKHPQYQKILPLPEFLIKLQVRRGFGAMPAFSEETIDDSELESLAAYLSRLRHAPED